MSTTICTRPVVPSQVRFALGTSIKELEDSIFQLQGSGYIPIGDLHQYAGGYCVMMARYN